MTTEPTTDELKREIERLRQELRLREQAVDESGSFPPLVDVNEFVQKNPIAAAAIALALGVTLGYVLKNTKLLDVIADKLSETMEKGIADDQTMAAILSRLMK